MNIRALLSSKNTHICAALICVFIFAIPFLHVTQKEQRAGYGKTDFGVFYTASIVLRGHTPLSSPDIYITDLFRPLVKHVRTQSGGTKFLYPPQAAVLFAPFSALSFDRASLAWLWFNVALYIAAYYATIIFLIRDDWKKYRYSLFLLATACSAPVYEFIGTGQINGMTFAFIVLTLIGITKTSSWSGIPLAIATSIKLFPALLALLFIVKKQWAALCAYISTLVALWLATIPFFGWKGLLHFYDYPLKALLAGEINTITQSSSLFGTFRKMVKNGTIHIDGVKNAVLNGWVSTGLTALAIILLCLCLYLIVTRKPHIIISTSMLIALVLLFSKFVQTQYTLFLLPLALYLISTWSIRSWPTALYHVLVLYCLLFWTLIPALHALFLERLNLIGVLLCAGYLLWHVCTKKAPGKIIDNEQQKL